MDWVTNLNKPLKILVIVIVFTNSLFSKDFETYLENYFNQRTPSSISTVDISLLQDQFDYYSNHKININKASLKKLKELPLVNETTLKELLQYRIYKSEYELIKKIESLNEENIVKFILRECLTTQNKEENGFKENYIIRNQNNLEEKKGFINDSYKGSALNLYQKLNIKSNEWELNTIWDKDAGEIYLNDFSSYSLKYEDDKIKLIAGDYGLSYGLGNILDQSFMNFKNSDFINTASKFGNGANPNKSTLENNFFRGVYAEYIVPIDYLSSFKISSFYSNFNRSATIDENSKIVSSIYNSGYYRTDTEINKLKNLNEQFFGMDIEFSLNNFRLGLLTSYLKYSNVIESSSFSTFLGKEGLLNSFYGSYNFKENYLKFEIALDAKQNISLRNNYLRKITNNLKFLFNLRCSQPEYRAPYANNFGEQSYVSNEKGILTGFVYNQNVFDVSIYADFFNSEYKNFTTTKPMRGVQYFMEIQTKYNESDYKLRLSYEKKSDSFILDSINSNLTNPNTKLSTRFDISKYLGNGVDFRGILEFSYTMNNYTKDNKGSLVQLDIKKQDNILNLNYGFSYTIFNTTSFESVIYGYQYQVPGLAIVYPYYLEGNNFSAFLKYNIFKQLDIWLRFNHLFKNKNGKIGSGTEEIIGNNRSQLIVQLQFKSD